jgi:hypothetical protein
MRASVCRKVRKPIARPGTIEPAASRPVAEMMPAEAVTSSPNALPRATTHSPVATSSELPSGSARRRGTSTESSAMSSRRSRPATLAGISVPPGRTTRSSGAAEAM